MTLKDKLPDRLKCSPLLTMESDSDIETIAESIVNLSDSDGDFFSSDGLSWIFKGLVRAFPAYHREPHLPS